MAKSGTPAGDAGGGEALIPVELREALEERYLTYALSTITGRALPDARDGLKPVHRRILYGMQTLRLAPDAPFKKCAKIVGDVMGSFHPHGDQAIYDALVRLAQDFSSRYPLVDGQGNFGNVDGDAAAAYRYTEARMTAVARLLLEGIDEDAIDFRPNYSGEEQEPVVLPAALPNLLANGAQGIAVGMATSVPPHNLAELCDAALYLISHREATAEQLMNFVQGPDFPTGGVVVDPRPQIVETYRTGRGSFRLRARWHKEETARGQWVAVVTEIPYGVQKSRLIEKLAELIVDKKAPLAGDVRDESAEDVRVVIEPRARAVDPALMMETLFKLSELEIRFPVNMNVLVDGAVPRVVSLDEALRQWLDHRREVLERRSRHRLAAIIRRLEVLDGMIIVFLNLDEVIRIIREEDEPKQALKSAFDLTDVQVDYILDTRLRALRRLEEMELRKEREKLIEERAEIEGLLAEEAKQWKAITAQIRELKKTVGDPRLAKRRTTFEDAPEATDIDLAEALIEREPITVVVSQKGWIRALKGHVSDLSQLQFKGDDALDFSFFAQTTSKVLALASNGKAFTLDASKLPGGRGHGEPIRLMAEIDEDAAIVKVFLHTPDALLLLVSDDGRGFVVSQNDLVATTRKGRAVFNVDPPAKLKIVAPAEGDHVAIIGENRKLLVFPLSEAPQMARGKGVRLQRYKDGGVADAKVFALADGLTWTDTSARVHTVDKRELAEWVAHRAEAGRLPPRGFPKNNRFG
ncbi:MULTISPECIES: DNA topoisomerase IV subunit A [Methylosinus]|uniref:DNA topoisomerase 4 subunit A n=1 Tax=Methylosinus trichosporium (strain ATCC 35070 / NCIMB 11131 / UNIQEM 75 / OB3b) TaxID=595536 RepID=A0A2D2CZE1_METT3|nr:MULTISPECIES: DNA topoisomerase IV subunit A [Methylosinus]ATQ68100.1 DNA topoisomerase IV subunit A [Methylosinus trichosporium OB3b]OBS54341.1 DNA topoisomerase IV subunit A [Methylosinus sp. 3S-1]